MSYTINITLPKKLAEFGQEQVKKGYYSSFSELVREGLRCVLVTKPIPTFKMSTRADKKALKAFSDYKAGKAVEISSFKELEGK